MQRRVFGGTKHGAGDNTLTCFLDPNENVVEYTTELETIEDEEAWEPRVFDSTSPQSQDQWGTGGSMTETMLPVLLKQTDGGLWTPSPI